MGEGEREREEDVGGSGDEIDGEAWCSFSFFPLSSSSPTTTTIPTTTPTTPSFFITTTALHTTTPTPTAATSRGMRSEWVSQTKKHESA